MSSIYRLALRCPKVPDTFFPPAVDESPRGRLPMINASEELEATPCPRLLWRAQRRMVFLRLDTRRRVGRGCG